jgi:hypothetical protein
MLSTALARFRTIWKKICRIKGVSSRLRVDKKDLKEEGVVALLLETMRKRESRKRLRVKG